jgi:hypothetical protein
MSALTNQSSRRISATLILVTLAAATLLFVHSVLAQRAFGFVINLHGDWVLDSSQTLKVGSTLRAGGRVHARSPSDRDFIEIADRRGQVIITKSCRVSDCRRPFTLPREESGVASRVLEAAMAFISNDPVRFAVLISRGGELREAVVKLSGEQADISSVMANKSSGKYFLRFVPESAGAAPNEGRQLGPVGVNWNANKSQPITIKGLTPGLYEVQLLNGQDMEPEEPGTEAWVLFVRPEHFDEVLCSFREAINLASRWGRSTRADSKRQFLRGFLGYLDSKER